jgi:hypothetical protein
LFVSSRFQEDHLSPQQLNELRKKADDYLERASGAVDPLDERLWLGLARECLNLVSSTTDLSHLDIPLAPMGPGFAPDSGLGR